MPFKYSRKQKIELLKKFVQYVDEAENPKIVEFCYLNNIDNETLTAWSKQNNLTVKDDNGNIYDYGRIMKKSKFKQQTFLSDLALEKGQNPGGPIFLLKALHGYKDSEPAQQPTTVNLNIEKVLQAQPDKLETGVQDLLQTVKIDNNRKRKPASSKN